MISRGFLGIKIGHSFVCYVIHIECPVTHNSFRYYLFVYE